ncbi:MAG TPA: hypothetical protein VJY34_19550 [Roseiarcus sp.]|nr:hypothetical protein [Roseiarcus sp.]
MRRFAEGHQKIAGPPNRRYVVGPGRIWSAYRSKQVPQKTPRQEAPFRAQSHDIPLPPAIIFGYIPFCAVVVVEARPFDLCHGSAPP